MKDTTPDRLCDHCEETITGTGYREPGDPSPRRREWCSEDCHDEAAEAYWTSKWSA